MLSTEDASASVQDKSAREDLARRIGAQLREARKAVGLTQEQAAARLGVHAQSYHKWEKGDYVRSWTRLTAACEVFETSPNEILGYDPTDKLDTVVKEALDAELLGAALQAIALLAAAKATPEEPSGGDSDYWTAMGGAFAEVIAMTLRGADAREAGAFLSGVGYLLRR